MPRPQRPARHLWSDIDPLGGLELVGLLVYTTVAFGLLSTRLVGQIWDEPTPTASSWLVGAGVGAVLGLATVVGTAWSWRRRGGRRLMRLSDRAVRDGELPESLSLRIRILRELERRERALQTQVPAYVAAGLWTVIAALQLVTDHSIMNTAVWVLLWGIFAVSGVQGVRERRRRPQLRFTIDHLRENPLEVPPPRDRATSA